MATARSILDAALKAGVEIVLPAGPRLRGILRRRGDSGGRGRSGHSGRTHGNGRRSQDPIQVREGPCDGQEHSLERARRRFRIRGLRQGHRGGRQAGGSGHGTRRRDGRRRRGFGRRGQQIRTGRQDEPCLHGRRRAASSCWKARSFPASKSAGIDRRPTLLPGEAGQAAPPAVSSHIFKES